LLRLASVVEWLRGMIRPERRTSRAAAGLAAATLTLLCASGRFAGAAGEPSAIKVAYLHQERAPAPSVSPLDEVAADEGLAGARLGIGDNTTTGRFIGQSYALVERRLKPNEEALAAAAALGAEGVRFVVTDVDAEPLRAAAAANPHLVFFNARATDDALRAECRSNLVHTIPSRAMLADGLAQYLVWKRWRRWFLVVGQSPGDRLSAAAVRRAAKRFGAEIAVEKAWSFQTGNARADTGHVTLQTEIPSFTSVADHDVLVVADEANAFGEYLAGRTARPRPVAGTHNLVATGWSAVNEQWGAAQLASRFMKLAGRRMTAVDYAAWAAVRSIGEAATRSRSGDPDRIAAYLRGPAFLLAGFKGRGQSFREWDGQMRQPILIAGARLLVSASPQAGFLHRTSELDTLGIDREESPCKP
jgi:ABC transporter substrate binding protein (PQQ-dependent alcohol dehydrogenase system)